MRRSTVPVLLLAALSFFAGLGRGAISDSDEAFYAEAAREMVESGDWLTPHFNYEPRLQKPALYYWLTAGLYLVTGPSAFAARFWSALAGLGLVLVTLAAGRRWFDEATGLLAGAITATAFGCFALARMALPDLPLAFFITLSIWTCFVATLERERRPRRWLLVASMAAALGFLVKGPLAVIIPLLVVLPVLLIERRTFNIRFTDLALASLAFVIIATPWYGAMWLRHGSSYLEGFFVGDNVERFTTARFNDPRPWWFYVPVIAGGFLPWTPLALLWIAPALQFVTRRRALSTIDLRLLLWGALPLVFFTISIGKQPRYVLPILPPLAVLLAGSIVERTSAWRGLDGSRVSRRPNRAVQAACLAAGLFLVTIALLVYRARGLFLNVEESLSTTAAIVIGLAGATIALLSVSKAWRAAPASLAAAAAVTFAVLPYATLAAPRDSTVHQMARLVRQLHDGHEPIGTYKVFVRNLVFYTGLKHTDLIHDEHLVDWLGRKPSVLVVMPEADTLRLEAMRGLSVRRLAELPYFDEGSLRVGTLIAPDPARNLTRVVLARIARDPPIK